MFIVNVARVKQGLAAELVPDSEKKIEGGSRGDVDWAIAPVQLEDGLPEWSAVLMRAEKESAIKRLQEDKDNPGQYVPTLVKNTSTEEIIVFIPHRDNDPVLLIGKTQIAKEALGALRLFKPYIELERVKFDIQRLNSQYKSSAWMLAFAKEGHVKAGMLYGTTIMQDPLVEGGSLQTLANQAGIELPLPGEMVKVRVLRDGGIQLYHTYNYGLLQDKGALNKTVLAVKELLSFEE